MEESSVCSRDSEDAAPATAWQREEAEILETRVIQIDLNYFFFCSMKSVLNSSTHYVNAN